MKSEKNDIAVDNKRVKGKKICMSLSRNEERRINSVTEKEDKMSIFIIVMILAVCFIVGIYLGWLLYRIAIIGSV